MKTIDTFDKKKAARERSTIWYKTFGKLPEVKAKRKQTLLSWRADKPSNYLCQLARQRSKELNITFDLCPEDILIPAKCPALDVPFEYGTPYAMSIDRINPKLGYVKGNVQVISRKANLMKQDASSEELRTFAKWANKSQN